MGKLIYYLAYGKVKKFVLIVILLALAAAPSSCSKENEKSRRYKIGLITNNRNGLRNIQGFKDKLADLGYHVGQNVDYMTEESPVSKDNLIAVLDKMVKAKVDLIFTAGTPTGVAAYKATADTEIPVIFGVIADPIAAGVMSNLTNPGGNMTGVKLGANQARRLQFLLEMAPGIRRILVPYNPEDAASSSAVTQIEEVASSFGIEIIRIMARNKPEVMKLLGNMPARLDAIFLVPGTTVNIHLKRLLAVAHTRRLPVSGPSLAQVEEGALMTYGFNHYKAGRQAARMADQVLKGTNPGNLPVETAEFFLAINLEAADMIGLQIPYPILQQAEIIIRPAKN